MKISSGALQKPSIARDLFLHLGIGFSLYGVLTTLLILLFNIVSTVFPEDPSYLCDCSSYDNPYRVFSFIIVSLILCSALYVFLEWLSSTFSRISAKSKQIDIRYWFAHIVLFISGFATVFSLIFLFGALLLGTENTAATVTMSALSGIVFGLVFKYYFWRTYAEEIPRYLWFILILAAGALVVGSIVLTFIFLGSPFTQRSLERDAWRAVDLMNMRFAVQEYYDSNNYLPQNFEELNSHSLLMSGYALNKDPGTNQNYEYINQGEDYSVCATFELPSTTTTSEWSHGDGRTCFFQVVDKDVYDDGEYQATPEDKQ